MKFTLARRVAPLAIVLLLLTLAACSPKANDRTIQEKEEIKNGDTNKSIVVYSGRKEALIKPVIAAFTKKTGIEVKLREGSTAELAVLLLEEKDRPQAEVFIAQDAGTMNKLSSEGVLEKYVPKGSEAVPADLKSFDQTWVGVSGRIRALVINTTLVPQADAPAKLQDLRNPKWKAKVAMASIREASVVAWLESLVALRGEEYTLDLLEGLKANGVKVLNNHEEVAAAVGKGEFAVGIVNQYYVFREKDEHSTPVAVIYPDQEEGGVGTLVNASTVALIKGKAGDNAKKFADFLLEKEAQQLFAQGNYEYPLAAGVAARTELVALDSIRRTPGGLAQLGSEIDKAVEIWDRSGIAA
ncbi:MAG TPA: extracellular solute-binding protein [Actinomycetota bacterium]|nr:extracellular solute-binding protein [Actinomycetota bacterium]